MTGSSEKHVPSASKQTVTVILSRVLDIVVLKSMQFEIIDYPHVSVPAPVVMDVGICVTVIPVIPGI